MTSFGVVACTVLFMGQSRYCYENFSAGTDRFNVNPLDGISRHQII